MVKIHSNYSPPCGYIFCEVLKCSSEAELHLNRTSFEICIPQLSRKRASQVLDKTSVFFNKPARTQISMPSALVIPFAISKVCKVWQHNSTNCSLLLLSTTPVVTVLPPKLPLAPARARLPQHLNIRQQVYLTLYSQWRSSPTQFMVLLEAGDYSWCSCAFSQIPSPGTASSHLP